MNLLIDATHTQDGASTIRTQSYVQHISFSYHTPLIPLPHTLIQHHTKVPPMSIQGWGGGHPDSSHNSMILQT